MWFPSRRGDCRRELSQGLIANRALRPSLHLPSFLVTELGFCRGKSDLDSHETLFLRNIGRVLEVDNVVIRHSALAAHSRIFSTNFTFTI